MGDFLVWLSPQPVPERIRRRWHWPREGSLAVRDTTTGASGVATDRLSTLVCIGFGHGRRGRRGFTPASRLAPKLLASIRDRGCSGLDDRLGTFCGAVIDEKTEQLVVWRDRFGRHPIQMVRLQRGWAITSSPTLAAQLSAGEPRWSHVASFITGESSTTDADFYEDLYRVRPGECIRFVDGAIDQRWYWWTPSRVELHDPVERMRRLLIDIGRLYGSQAHTLALSAGLDSATLAAVSTTIHPRSEAITFSDPDTGRDETDGGAHTACALGIEWRPFHIGEHCPLSRLDDHRFPVAWGPPAHPDFAWKLPWHRSLAKRRGNRPVVYGNGADDALWVPPGLWFESRWYRRDWAALRRAWPHVSTRRWLRAPIRCAIRRYGNRALRSLLPDWPAADETWSRPTRWLDVLEPAQPSRPWTSPVRYFRWLRQRRLRTFGWEHIVRSLATESRRSGRRIWTPFLDAEFWELSLSLNPDHLVEGGRQKAILRRAVGQRLPDACLTRRKVGGFDPVVERGLADRSAHRVHQLMARSRLAEAWWAFDPQRFVNAYEAYRHGDTAGNACRGSWAVWKTLAVELWIRRHNRRSDAVEAVSTKEVQP